MILRSCVEPGCGQPSSEGRCPEHRRKAWETSDRRYRLKLSGGAEQARRKRILERYLYCCHVCGQKGADEVDHVVPLAEGGVDTEDNLAPIHREPCHREKTAAESRRARA